MNTAKLKSYAPSADRDFIKADTARDSLKKKPAELAKSNGYRSGRLSKNTRDVKIQTFKSRDAMNRPIAILLIVLIIASLIFSTFALFQGKFAVALSVYPLLILAFFFIQSSKKK